MYSQKKIFILIFLGFILSILLSSYYIIKYDKYISEPINPDKTHVMLKDETFRIWFQAAKIVEDVKGGENFFLSGDALYTKPLPERLVAIYSLLSGNEIIDEWEPNIKIKLGGKLPFLIIQSLVYYLSLVYLVLKISKIFPIKNCFYIVFFLSFEHTLFQYHSSFWSESFFFTLQILLLCLLLKNSYKTLDNVLIGIIVGVMFLQRSAAIFYLIPIIIYFIFYYKRKSIKPIIVSSVGYMLIIFLLGIYNHKKTENFYIFPSEGKQNIYTYFCIPLLAQKDKVSESKIRKNEVIKAYKWLKENNIKLKDEFDLDKIPGVLFFETFIENEENKIKLYDYFNKRQYEIIIENPLMTIKLATTRIAHFMVLDPTHNYYYNEHTGNDKNPVFTGTQTHKNWIPYRIIYTLFIYFVCLLGIIYFIKQKNYQLLLLFVLSILYYIILLGWKGTPRLFVPNLIYLSFFFGNGVTMIINPSKKKSQA